MAVGSQVGGSATFQPSVVRRGLVNVPKPKDLGLLKR